MIALFSASVVIWVFQAVNYLDIMIEDGRDYLIYINYSLLNFPKILSKLLPFVLFFSLFYVINKYEQNNELMIFWNFGVGKLQVINFFFLFSIFIFLLQLILTTLIVPKSQNVSRSLLRDSEVNFFGNFIKAQKFNDTIKGVTIYSEKKDEKGNLYNLYLKKNIGSDDFQITYAKRGIFKEINNTPVLVLYNGETISKKNKEITNFSFSKSDFLLKSLETNTTTYTKTQEMSTNQLIKCLSNIYLGKKLKDDLGNNLIVNCSMQNLKNLLKESYKRLVIPFYIPFLILIPFILIIVSKEDSNFKKIKLFTFLFGLLIIIFSETTIRFISDPLSENIKIVIIPFSLMIVIYLFFIKKFKSFKVKL
tara:strand:+ start:91 stop:1182 length:1092 start_codon:yes stop_codon:yes gene_type:complete